ncbi:N-terminal nucleophile aminohydrolase [Westerdykella ornata]|uniref:N-terminal nucleophile aminohydrolase n=1 Tax=Westerdykella ornata TaxID=318751 RepID=A0A6A6JEE2_WESOR|nr:N-terminal nucleophile aminohydrolase [Westerdykella ornata]KAF2274533.1 N-terminal nucleophile aminohydrolase [Westerdykella ornata]
MFRSATSTVCLPLLLFADLSYACTRVSYTSGEKDGSRVVIGRTLDWSMPPFSSMYAFPAGLQRNGSAGENSLEWVSKYGSVITTIYDILTMDGVNTEGLHGGFLYLAGTDFGTRNSSLPGLSISLWLQYFLDNYRTVAEAKADLMNTSGAPRFQVRSRGVIPGLPTVGHLVLGDASGDNLVMEYLDGKLQLYHSHDYQVMTNEPPYDEQLMIQRYLKTMANTTLPGTPSPIDRFARMADNLRQAPVASTMTEAITIVQSLLRTISTTLRSQTASVSNAATVSRTMADTKDGRYFFESATDPVSLWVSLNALDLSPRGTVKKLSLDPRNGTGLAGRHGEATHEFVDAEPYVPLLANSEKGDGTGGSGPVTLPGIGTFPPS